MEQLKLIKKAKAGDEKAFEKLLSLHSDRLYRTAFIYTGNREDALDTVQETAYKAFLAIKQLEENKYFLTWLTRILINSAYDLRKKQKKDVPFEFISDLPTNKNERTDEHIDLVRAINELKDNQRDAIILFYYHDLPIKEVSEIMNIPENTVKTNLQRAKKQLKNTMKGAGYNEGKVV